MGSIENIGSHVVVLLFSSLAAVLAVLIFLLWVGWRKEEIRGDTCPYCKRPMRFGMDVAQSIVNMVNAFFVDLDPLDNPKIDFVRAAYCPETGRIFPNCVGQNDQISLSWDFLSNRCPGTYVSWGSLSEEERGILKLLHGSVEGFQTEVSSLQSRPQDGEEEFYSLAPGPLYVDRREKTLLGWQKVPGTRFEVLVLQRPRFHSLEETL